MNSRDQAGPSTPFQQAPNSSTMLHSPAYPSPAHSDTEPSRYRVDGLGLYQYSQPFPTSADRLMFSSSSRPTQDWGHTTSMPSAPIVNPWTSGAYDHPVCPDNRSNMLWPDYHSHRSSTSSQRALSVFSGDGSEHSFPAIKMEGGHGWAADNDFSATVAPERLTHPGPYEGAYGSPLSPYESDSTSGPAYKVEFAGQAPSPGRRSRSSQSDGKASPTRRKHARRTKIPDADAKFRCDICHTTFVRAYNKKTHMARHSPNRSRDHHCQYDDCENKFERKTDLQRHVNSVHLHEKPHQCELCGKRFARKDTLNRHDIQGGCPRRHEVDMPTLIARSRSMQSSPAMPQSYLPSPQPEMYAGFHTADNNAAHGMFGSRGQQQQQQQQPGQGGGPEAAVQFDGRFSRFSNPSFGHGGGPQGL